MVLLIIQAQGAGWAMALVRSHCSDLAPDLQMSREAGSVRVQHNAFLPLDRVEHRRVDTVYSSFAAARPKLERNSLTSVWDPEENSFIASYHLSCGTCSV